MAEYLQIHSADFVMVSVEDFDYEALADEFWQQLPPRQLTRLQQGRPDLWLRTDQGRLKKFTLVDADAVTGMRLYHGSGHQVVVRKEPPPLSHLVLSIHATTSMDRVHFVGHLLSGARMVEVTFPKTEKISVAKLAKKLRAQCEDQGLIERRRQLRLTASKDGNLLTQLHGLVWVPPYSKHAVKPRRRLRHKVQTGMILLRRFFLASD